MKSNNKMLCLVNLPNGTTFGIQCDPKSIGQKCLEEVCKNLGFTCETEYFGLVECSKNGSSFRSETDGNIQSRTAQYFNWINLRNPLGQHKNTGQPYSLDFRVKFWVPPHLVIQDNVRNMFYMQAKSDLLNGRLQATSWQHSAELGALLAHADEVIFDSNAIKLNHNANQTADRVESNDSIQQTVDATCSGNTGSRSDACGCIPIDGLKNLKSSTHKRKKRRFSKTKVILNADCDIDADDNDDSSESNDDHLISRQCNLQMNSPLHVYDEYIICVDESAGKMPRNHLNEIANQHSKLLKSTSKSTKYILLQSVFKMAGLGEETFSGMRVIASTPAQYPIALARNRYGETNDWSEHMRLRMALNSHENDSTQRCDIIVGPHGISINTGAEKTRIPYNAASSATPNKRIFRLVFLTDAGEQDEIEIKLVRPRIAIALYRSITEKHAFYSCETVGTDVTKQFIRDFRGTIASMFNVDTKLGRLYVFDIQRTYREVYDHARRVLHAKGMDIITTTQSTGHHMNLSTKDDESNSIDEAIGIRRQMEKQIAERISEAITCRICMDRVINTSFTPCGHIASCYTCAEKCATCPLCRTAISCISRIYLPMELQSAI